jgi:phage/conjugal plasmid C-4 type zinc finger TraR family protein
MASGWTPDGAVQDQINDTVMDGVLRARSNIPRGQAAIHCIECGEEIAEPRRRALPGVQTCVTCQAARDQRPAAIGFNRRGNKGSQIK